MIPNDNPPVKDHCPICGHEFDLDEDVVFGLVFCPTEHYGPEEWIFSVDELITSDDDYAWCQ